MNKIAIIYHTDLDGYGVKVIGRIYANLKGYEEKSIIFIRADYYKNENSYKKLFIDDLIEEQIKGHENEIDEIILGDISVKSEETAEYLNELSKNKKVILRDHHDTATWLNKYEWAKVRETDDEGIARSGTYWTAKELLSDEYIEKHPNLKKFIYLTDKFDAWTWVKSDPKLDKAVNLSLLFGAINEEGFDEEIYPKLLLENEVDLFDERMKFYLKIKNDDLYRQKWAAYYSMKRGIYTYKDGDKEIPLKVAIISTENGSIIAEKLREIFAMKHEEYDFILNFGIGGGLALRCSENPKVPVNKILMQMGDGTGGGHICSAGGKLEKGRIEMGLETIFKDLKTESLKKSFVNLEFGYFEDFKKDEIKIEDGYRQIEKGLKDFIYDNKNNEYRLDCEPREVKSEKKYVDCECSYLSAIINIKLIEKYYLNNKSRIKIENGTHDFRQYDCTKGSRRICYINNENEEKKVMIGFDVMNSVERGKLISESDKFNIEQLEKIYHKIGNFIFYPRAIVRKKGGNNDLNIVHNVECHENWTKVLVYLKEHWSEYQFSDGFCLFEEYIKMSLQQFYTKVGWDEVKKLVENPKEYNEIISNEKNLIDFYKKIENENCVEEIEYNEYSIKIIIAIIEIRTRLIIIMVRKFLESEEHSK